ncbi:MAG: trigger factor [Bdellovibrionales bacterium]|nr:trigger factor [Bdellovibrionales bacterium]
MKIEVENYTGLKHRLNISVPADQVQKTIDNVTKKWKNLVTIKGFRKGKAPLQIVSSQYAHEIRSESIRSLVNSSMDEAMDRHQLVPTDSPEVNLQQFDGSSDFNFTAEFETFPKIDSVSYEGLEVDFEPKPEVTEKDVDEFVQRFQEIFTEYKPISEERPAQLQDVVQIESSSYLVGESESPQFSQPQMDRVVLGKGEFLPGFEDAIVGMKVNDSKEFTLAFPEDQPQESLRGKSVCFKVVLKAILLQVLPEMNDEFATKFLGSQNMEVFRSNVKDRLIRERKEADVENFHVSVLKALTEKNSILIPTTLVQFQKESIINSMFKKWIANGRFEEQHMSPEDKVKAKKNIYEKYKEDVDNSAQFYIHSQLLVNHLVNKLNVDVSDDELLQNISAKFSDKGLDPSVVTQYFQKHAKKKEDARRAFLEEKVFAFILEKVVVKAKASSSEA